MPTTVHLTAAVYAYRDSGGTVFQTLQDMHRFENIRLLDAALIDKRDDGRLHVVAVADHAQSGGHGHAIKALIQRIYPRHLSEVSREAMSVEQTAALLDELHIDATTLHSLVDDMPVGGALVLALAEDEWQHAVENTLQGYDGRLVRVELSPDVSTALTAAGSGTP
jgi:uncharacterized membrane protein